MYQLAPQYLYQDPSVRLESTMLQAMKQFTYLSSMLNNGVTINHKADARIKTASACSCHYHRIWKQHGNLSTDKIKVYDSVVPTTLHNEC